MAVFPDVLGLAALILTGALLVANWVRGVHGRKSARREHERAQTINQAIIEYFRKTGVRVTVETSHAHGEKGYTALIESEPMKRFRLSHIIESTLRDHIDRTCGLELEKVFWRFPIPHASVEASHPANISANANALESDDYISEGLEHYRHIPKTEATELDWEHFQLAATGESLNSIDSK